MKTKKVQPVLVEVKEKTPIWSYKRRRVYYNQANFNDEDETYYYKLILVSVDFSEEIKVGDLTIDVFCKYPHMNFTSIDNEIELERYAKNPKFKILKVIATQEQIP